MLIKNWTLICLLTLLEHCSELWHVSDVFIISLLLVSLLSQLVHE